MFMGRFALTAVGLSVGFAVVAAACTGAGATAVPKGGTGGTLEGPTWVLVSYDVSGTSTTVPAGVYADAVFKAGTVSGLAGCNAYTGSYQAVGSALTAGPFASTRKACPPPASDVETAFLDGMGKAASYSATADALSIFDASGAELLVFEAGTAGTLAGPTWHMLYYNNGTGGAQSAAAGADVTAVFGTDGRVAGNATCNQYDGPYTAKDATIAIGPLASTRMACPSDALSAQEAAYLAAIQKATTYAVQGTHLELRDASGALMAEYESR
jgi:heat shock protein HslJ